MRNKGLIIGVVVILLALGGYFSWKNTTPKIEGGKDVVKIGVILPLTGDAAAYGNSLKKGLELNKNTKVKYIIEDSKGDPKTAVNIMNKLISVDKTKIIIGDMFTNTTLAISPIADKNNILLISPTASSSQVSENNSSTFRLYPSEKEEADLLCTFYNDTFKNESAEIIVVNEDAMLSVANVIGKKISSNRQVYSKGTKDFNSILSKIDSDVKNIFIIGYIEESALLIKQSRERNKQFTFIGLSTLYSPQLTSLLGNINTSIFLSAPYFSLDADNKITRDFISAYEKKYGESPDVWAGYGYDSGLIIDFLLNKNENDSYIDRMYKVNDFEGVTGNITINKDKSINKIMNVLEYKNGNFRTVQ